MRVNTWLAYGNIVVLMINAIMIWVIVATSFPPLLDIAIFVAFMAGSAWLSCLVNGQLPKKTQRDTLYPQRRR